MSKKGAIAFIRADIGTFGGAERVIVNLSNELAGYYKTYLINFYPNESPYIIKDDVNKIILIDKKKRMRYTLLSCVKNLRKQIIQKKIKVIVCVGVTGVLITWLATLGLTVTTIFYEQSTLKKYDFDNKNWKSKALDKITQYIINHYMSYILTLTNKEKNHYKQQYKIPSCRIGVIPNFLEDQLENQHKQYDIRSKCIITVGRISPEKGYENLIKVAKIVLHKYPDWEWHIYGDGDKQYVDYIKKSISDAGLERNLILKGVEKNIYDIYPRYSMEILTSFYEGFSMVLLEGKACWLPEVSFDIYSGPSDLIQEGINGYLIPPFNINGMAEKICYLIEHPQIRKSFSDYAQNNINKFLKENVIQQWINLLKKLSVK